MNLCLISLFNFKILESSPKIFWGLFIVSLTVILGLTLPMLNLRSILSRYWFSSNNSNTTKRILIIFSTAVISVLVTCEFTFESSNISTLLTLAAIFAGLMFNLLLLAFDLLNKMKIRISQAEGIITEYEKSICDTIDETYGLIIFLILVSLSIICLSIPFVFNLTNLIISKFLTGLLTYLLITLVRTLFIVLKKVFVLIEL